jgi:hypothetical protein
VPSRQAIGSLKLTQTAKQSQTQKKIPQKRETKKTVAKMYEKIPDCAKAQQPKCPAKIKNKKRRLLRKPVNSAD